MRFPSMDKSVLVTGVSLSFLLPMGLAVAPVSAASPTVDLRVATYNTCGHGCMPTPAECDVTLGRDCPTKLAPWTDERAASAADDVVDSELDIVATQEIGNNPVPQVPDVDIETFRVPFTEAMEERGYAEAPAEYEDARHPRHDYPLRSGAGRYTYYDAERFSHLDTEGKELPHDLFWLPDSTEDYGKTVNWNILRELETDTRVVVVNMHLEYRSGDAEDPNGWARDWDTVRFDDARRTASHITQQNPATRNLPVIFAGDMNSSSTEAGTSPYAAFRDLGFDNARDLAPEDERSGEHLASYNGGKIPLPEGDQIDYVFVEEGTTVLDWALVPQTEATSGEQSELLRSDHNMVYATLSLDSTGAARS
ncbi:hypothetical protein J4H86_18480 [Spiractinospora alimapuensis]|uniref:hypothetical protein n=1 Tax=Spiractinospora alimapuensis TaxID=2820884 RepID=UPI001F2F4C61|nr:hypothetical protein [Spiractinospora alimapuensis]QVQ50837.1 hypothetical protein J4H86_18480 [Spiractinospora alimapuensis]